MTEIDWTTHQLFEAVGARLGLRKGRAHYYSTLLVRQALDAFIEQLAADPRVADLVVKYRARRQEQAFMKEDRKRKRLADRRVARLEGQAGADAIAVARYGVFEEPDRGEVDRHTDALMDFARRGDKRGFLELANLVGDRSSRLFSAEALWRETRRRLGKSADG